MDHPSFDRQQRRVVFSGPRPRTDLLLARIPGTDQVLVGMRGDGYVRLSIDDAREFAFGVLELAGIPTEDE